MTELSAKFDAVSNSFVDIYRLLDGDASTQDVLLNGFNEVGFLRASVKCMEESQMQDTEAAVAALKDLEAIEFIGSLLKYNKQIIVEQIALMLNQCEDLRLFIKDSIAARKAAR